MIDISDKEAGNNSTTRWPVELDYDYFLEGNVTYHQMLESAYVTMMGEEQGKVMAQSLAGNYSGDTSEDDEIERRMLIYQETLHEQFSIGNMTTDEAADKHYKSGYETIRENVRRERMESKGLEYVPPKEVDSVQNPAPKPKKKAKKVIDTSKLIEKMNISTSDSEQE
jgi:hypothetical protein